jgi:hypothetical protein
MDYATLLQHLEGLVEWEPPKRLQDHVLIKERKSLIVKLRKMGHDEDAINEVLDQMEEDAKVVKDGANITLPKKIKKILHEPKTCELGCGQMVINQVIQYTKHDFPIAYWRKRCTNCQYWVLEDGTMVRDVAKTYPIQPHLVKNRKHPTK